METARFWGREGAKMVSFVRAEKEKFMQIIIDECLEAAADAGKNLKPKDVLAIGGMIILGENEAESSRYYKDFEELWKIAYDAPPYHVPMGRMWSGSRQQVQDDVMGLIEKYQVDEIFVWHHIGYFGDEREKTALSTFAEAVIAPIRKQESA